MEYYSVANEGLVLKNTDFRQTNNSPNIIFVFSTTPDQVYGGLTKKEIYKKFKISDNRPVYQIEFDMLGRSASSSKNANAIKATVPDKLFRLINDKLSKVNDTLTKGILAGIIISSIEAYQINNKCIVCVTDLDSKAYSYSMLRDKVIAVVDGSMSKSILASIGKEFNKTIDNYKAKKDEFVTLSLKYDKILQYKNPEKLVLYHISPNENIKELYPRITNKPLTGENYAIPRISAAPSIDKCLYGVGANSMQDNKKFHVYRLKLTPKSTVVKPTTKLVPDVALTSEYWILDNTMTEYKGYFITIKDEKTCTWTYNTENLKLPKEEIYFTTRKFESSWDKK